MRATKTFEAYWDAPTRATLYLKRTYYDGDTATAVLIDSKGGKQDLEIEHIEVFDHNKAYRVKLPDLCLDSPYYVEDDHGLRVSLNWGRIVESDLFDNYFATNAPLGARLWVDHQVYRADFSLWAPTAQAVYIKLLTVRGRDYQVAETLAIYPLKRGEKGVWSTQMPIEGDHLYGDGEARWLAYRYLVCVDGICKEAQDPYAFATLANQEASILIAQYPKGSEVRRELPGQTFWKSENFTSPLDAVIYEMSIRDYTQDPSSGASHPGTFEGYFEVNQDLLTSRYRQSYLKDLGITHVQLLPVYDFGSIDEREPRKRYNWGYDPIQYLCVEGSLCADSVDPVARITALKNFVQKMHQEDLGVIMDVVYNHMFDKDMAAFENIVPGYYFRVDSEGKPSNGSFCGNDIDSTRKMMRRYILDATAFWMCFYGMDGFRFDLMGILDIETMNQVKTLVKEINPLGLVYGEGWNMPTALAESKKAMLDHADKMPDIGFFNDRFRDFYKGPTMADQVKKPGLLTGLLKGKSKWIADQGFSDLFISEDLTQSINYFECHDNHTLWDKLCAVDALMPESTRQQLQVSLNAFLVLSFGIPFIHAGQEWFRTKRGDHNSYRSGDAVNAIDWNSPIKAQLAIDTLKEAIALRKSLEIFKVTKRHAVLLRQKRSISRQGLLRISLDDNIEILMNLSQKQVAYRHIKGQLLYTSDLSKDMRAQMALTKKLNPYSLCVLQRKS